MSDLDQKKSEWEFSYDSVTQFFKFFWILYQKNQSSLSSNIIFNNMSMDNLLACPSVILKANNKKPIYLKMDSLFYY